MITQRTGDARLLRLAAFLRTLPRKRFNYNVWVGHDWRGAADLSCGTTACALGWATTIPSLRRAGLQLVSRGIGQYGYVVLKTKGRRQVYSSMTAAQEVFSLNELEASYIFVPSDDGDATAKQVARKIERFVSSGHVIPGQPSYV